MFAEILAAGVSGFAIGYIIAFHTLDRAHLRAETLMDSARRDMETARRDVHQQLSSVIELMRVRAERSEPVPDGEKVPALYFDPDRPGVSEDPETKKLRDAIADVMGAVEESEAEARKHMQ